jgi:hypothetical protein
MDIQELKKKLSDRIRHLSKQVGKDDPSMDDRDWDMQQERISAKINTLMEVLTMLS